ncbi:MAG: hypothetical protein ICV69_09920 [Thermoleophilaceae bacterium]|nr:hypothetical protein [Thermoleophilaceae bacterium]
MAAAAVLGAAVIVAVAAAVILLDSGGRIESGCEETGYAVGSSDEDGVFFAVVSRDCARSRGAWCETRDRRGPIARETVDPGIDQDCVVYSQFIGTGLATGSGRYLGECAGTARAGTGGRPDVVSGPDERCPGGAGSRLPSRKPRPTAVRIGGRAADPFRRPPAVRQGSDRRLEAPPWSLLTWRQGALTCYEPGQVIDARRFRGFAAVYRGGRQGEGLRGRILGSLRPDAKFAVGRQFFDFGRFLPYPIAEGGSCGRLGDADLLLSRTVLYRRPDLGPARTIVAGITGRNVRRVELATAGRTRLLSASAKTPFIAVLRGKRAPSKTPVLVRYPSGLVRRFPDVH